jgi:GNAT superfamily N-acetyltransferase
MSAIKSLPDRNSPDLHLDHPTSAEQTQIWTLYATIWGKALPLPQYMEECGAMLDVPLAEDGGMTSWVLVEKNDTPDRRAILSCCRTYRKRALVSRQGVVQEQVVYGVAAVFCDPQYRRHGYASRMMAELAKTLKYWQIKDGETCAGSILYSDIGKTFYSEIGWMPAPKNMHLEFLASRHPVHQGITSLYAKDLGDLCRDDEEISRQNMARGSDSTRLMIIPDHKHMLWHHAKEEFVFEKIYGRKPMLKGMLMGEPGNRVWAIWTHRLYSSPASKAASGNSLYILRLVIEREDAPPGEAQMEIKAKLEAIIQAAQTEATSWNLARVKIWNPSPLVEKLIEWTGIRCKKVERDRESIASLIWYGENTKGEDVDWISNEKYAWC